MRIIKDKERKNNLIDKIALLTGCSSGLGDVLKGGQVHLLHLDLESLDSVRASVSEFRAKSTRLNILVDDAGIRHNPKGRTKDGFELHRGTSHVAHFLLLELLRPFLIYSSAPDFHSGVVALSSTAHRNAPMDFADLN